MSETVGKATFATMYAGKAPWDIDHAQKSFVDMAGSITGAVLDAGCGTGENALYFASKGRKVTGIDYLEEPIQRAQRKAAERGVTASFLVKDALTLKDWPERFDSVIDCGLFHVFSDEDRKRYVAGLATVLKPGGYLVLLCFSNEESGTQGPRRVTQGELRDAFSKGWVVESLQPSRFEIIPDFKEMTFSEGGPKALLAVVRRQA